MGHTRSNAAAARPSVRFVPGTAAEHAANARNGRTRWRERLVLGAMAWLAILPYVERLRHPSLYSDDIVRVTFERHRDFFGRLLQPFNEHLAPLFELVSTVAWSLCGARLANAPLAYTLASFVPFVLCLGLLARIVWRETESSLAGFASLAVAGLLPLHAEVVGWYSASSFAWALLATLVAYGGALIERRRGVGLSIAAAAAAPGFSAIGLLAGPFAALRYTAAGRWRAAGMPLLGTLVYLGLVRLVGHDRAMAHKMNLEQLGPALALVMRAPSSMLILGSLGRADVGIRPLQAADCVITAAFVGATILAAWRCRDSRTRGLLLGGLWLVVGGYGLTLGARAGAQTQLGNVLPIQRYQLYPVFGLALLIGPAWAWGARRLRLETRHVRAAVTLALLAAALLAIHRDRFKRFARFYQFPGQLATLRALDRAEAVAVRAGFDPKTLVAALPPVVPAWFNHPDFSVWMLVGPLADGRIAGSTNAEHLSRLLVEKLTPSERGALWGGMDATALLERPGEASESVAASGCAGHFVTGTGFAAQARGACATVSLPAWAEFAFDTPPPDFRRLDLTLRIEGEATARGTLQVEVFWTGAGQRDWTPARSVTLTLVQTHGDRFEHLRLPFSGLPHWDGQPIDRVRVALRGERTGRVELESLKLLRP